MPSTLLSRRALLRYGLAGGALALAGGGWMAARRWRGRYEVRAVRTMMNSDVSILAVADSPDHGHRAIAAAFDRMAQAATALNRFDPDSAVGRLNRHGHLAEPPQDLLTVLARARQVSEQSGGAFDITVQPLMAYYFSLPRPVDLNRLDRQAVAARDRLVDYRKVRVDGGGVHLDEAGMGITLDGIAKGYIVDLGADQLLAHGIDEAVIDAGGDVRTLSRGPSGRTWTIGIADPIDQSKLFASVPMRNGALSTSGNYEIFFSADKRLFHIVDPHTGLSPDMYSSVTILAERNIDSDAFGTALFPLPLARIGEVMRPDGPQWLAIDWNGRRSWQSADMPVSAKHSA
ncbi:thiamine biosynthesis lipoprotein ApbE precursor [mine drainage metagenome]|uniref:FAD:protein FMN transferase n=1 Tax=mine drainage metagenome TaxID=410659 RepID=A0A1J5RDW9_9ZZZZ